MSLPQSNGPMIRSFSQAVHNLDYVGETKFERLARSNPVSTRLCSLGLVIPSATAGVADAALTLIATSFAILTLGTQPKINGIVHDFGNGSKRMLREPYAHLIRSLNLHPNTLSPIQRASMHAASIESLHRPNVSDSWFKQNVKSRLRCVATLICAVALLVFNVVKFVFAFALSLLALRKNKTLNQWTFEALIFPRIIRDICIYTILLINPQAKFDDHTLSDQVFGNLTRRGVV